MLKKYFARANTSSGCINLLKNNLKNIDTVYILDGNSKTAKTKLMAAVAGYFDSGSKDVECIYSPFDITKLDAIIIREYKFAIADRCCIEDGQYTLNTDNFIDTRRLDVTEDYLNGLSEMSQKAYSKLYTAYEKAKQIHDEWEKIYISSIDFDRLNSYCAGLISQLISSKNARKDSNKFERFFGASTMDGSVNYINNITAGLDRRYFIKGRPGTGKSTFLKKLANAALSAGYSMEVYYCSFDKNSLDMVLVPELSFCVFDSTAPHEMFPSEERDSILDFYTEGGLTGIDEKYKKQLELINKKYSFRIYEGTANLRIGNGYELEREYYLSRATNYEEISKLADKIIRKVTQ